MEVKVNPTISVLDRRTLFRRAT